jgi:nitric oxide reductase NorD protein
MDTLAADPDALPAALRARLDADAAHGLSARGYALYRQGVLSLWQLGRGDGPALAFAACGVQLARAIGEDALQDLVRHMLALASKTSAAVIERIIHSAPVAAARLGDAALFDAYLGLLALVAGQAPRGLRPMLEQSGPLLAQLTLGGLRRWAQWGIQAHRAHPAAQAAYFGLASADALAVLQQERRGTLFVDVQRRVNMYLRALFGRDFFMRPSAGDYESRTGYRPFIEDFLIHLPDAFDDVDGVAGADLYRASAVHCAAHLVFTSAPMPAEGLTAAQRAAVGMVEDARIEALAIARFPGLRGMWARLHAATPADSGQLPARIARALLDPGYQDPHQLVLQARALFGAARANLGSNRLSLDIGLALAEQLHAAGLRGAAMPAYRDDNRYVWDFSEADARRALQAKDGGVRQKRRNVSLMEFVNEIDVETAGDDAEEIWVLPTELFPYADNGKPYNEDRPPQADPVPYPEWDYQIQLERPAWTQVLEQRPRAGPPERIDQILAQHKPLAARLRYLVEALQPHGVQRLRKQEDGDELDLNAAIDAVLSLRRGDSPDPRLMIRHRRTVRDIGVLILLDLSESTGERLPGARHSVLELALDATVLTADTLHKIGDPFAVHGFCSNGRHAVHYQRFKDFGQPYDCHAKGRLAAMSGQLSTRMGTALRHATALLRQQPQRQKLLLVLTDGAPSDVDVRDPLYLHLDAKKAVEDAARAGIVSFCLSLDPQAGGYVARIFGSRNYLVLDNIERLPERLPQLIGALTRRA